MKKEQYINICIYYNIIYIYIHISTYDIYKYIYIYKCPSLVTKEFDFTTGNMLFDKKTGGSSKWTMSSPMKVGC